MKQKARLIAILTLFTTLSFGQNDFNSFLGKFKPLTYPSTIEKPICNATLNQHEVVNYLKLDIDDDYDSLIHIGDSEAYYCAEYLYVKDNITTLLYSWHIMSTRGQWFQHMAMATFSKDAQLIDQTELGDYSDYNEGFDSLTTLYTDKCMIELQASSHIYVTNIHTNVLLDEEGNKDAIDSTVIRTAYYNYNGNIHFIYEENLANTASVKVKFVGFDMGDAVYYDFESETGEDVCFGGCEDHNYQFAEGLEESEMNSENQGWGTNKELLNKWFIITYIERKQDLYIDGPTGIVKVIIKAELVEE